MARDFEENYCEHHIDACVEFRQWKADPDIAGIGVSAIEVIIAFCVTSVITLLVIIAGYLLDAIRDEEEDGLLNDLDHQVIRRVRSLLQRVTRRSLPELGYKRSRRDALERFVLVLSDQQIVTGLSICIIGYSKHCTMSSYHFFMVVALTWFSSTTHLSTLSLLQHYFRTHTGLKYARLVGMFALYIMLMVGMIVLYTTQSFQVPVQCRLEKLTLHGTPPVNYATAIVLFSYLTLTYLSKLACLSIPSRRTKLQTSFARRKYYHDRTSRTRYPGPTTIVTSAHRVLATFLFAYIEFLDSFLWQIILLVFGNFYGIRQLYWVLYVVRGSINIMQGNERDFGFGQLLALLLLALPCLAAVEASSDAKKGEATAGHEYLHDTLDASSRAAAPERAEFHTQPLSREPDLLVVPNAGVVFGGLFVYTLVTLILIAWYVAYSIQPQTYSGVEAGLAMAAILLATAMVAYVDDLGRLGGWEDNTWARLLSEVKGMTWRRLD